MSALRKKLLRDLWQLRAQALAIVLVLASGVAVFVAIRGSWLTLVSAQRDYYARYRLADVFAGVTRAPRAVLPRIEAIPGVAEVRARIVTDAAVDLPGVLEPGTLRLCSLPPDPREILNGLYLRLGHLPERDDEIVINEAFASAGKIELGAVLPATIHGRKRPLRVVGVGLAPEFVMQMRGGDLIPDDRTFGVVWMDERSLASAMDMEGAFDSLVVALIPGTSEQDVIPAIDAVLAPFGGTGAVGRDGLLSHRYLQAKFRQLESTARSMPLVFLAVAAFLLNVVLARLVAVQRAQIGTLKAFGYSDFAIGLHYLELCAVVVLLGAAAGIGVGVSFGHALMRLYRQYYRFPDLAFHLDARSALWAVAIAGGSSILGVIGAVRRAAALPPAEAMRPEPPPVFHASTLERLGLTRLLSTIPRMIARNLGRRPVRTGLSITGVAMAAAIVVVGNQTFDALEYIFALEYGTTERQDATVLFAEPVPAAAARDLIHLPGVLLVEPFQAVPVTLRSGHVSRAIAIVGMEQGASLRRLVDRDGRAIAIPPEGLAISRELAKLLGTGPGQSVEVELTGRARETHLVPVSVTIDDLMGLTAAMDHDALVRLAGGPELAVGAYLSADSRATADIFAHLKKTTLVASVTLRGAAMQGYLTNTAGTITVMAALEAGFAMLIAFSVIFNNARTALSERARELATMRVLGFTRGETAAVLLGEIGVVTAAAIPVGLALGSLLAALVLRGADSEIIRMPLVIRPSTYATATLVVLASTLASSLIVLARVAALDLVSVLKTRD